jgi:hypothetical protein
MITLIRPGSLAGYTGIPIALTLLLLSENSLAQGPCALPHDAVVTQSARLRLDGQTLYAAALSVTDPNENHSRLLVLDVHCRALLDETVDGLESRFDVRILGRTRLLQFVTMQVFGDGTGYVHRLLIMRNGQLQNLMPPIRHTGKDGFYLGPLAHGKGEGMVTWTADPSGESEADAHPYVVDKWQWRTGRLVGPVTYETTKKYMPSNDVVPRSNVVARAIGLPYRDQTGTRRFMNPDRAMKLDSRVEQEGGGKQFGGDDSFQHEYVMHRCR